MTIMAFHLAPGPGGGSANVFLQVFFVFFAFGKVYFFAFLFCFFPFYFVDFQIFFGIFFTMKRSPCFGLDSPQNEKIVTFLSYVPAEPKKFPSLQWKCLHYGGAPKGFFMQFKFFFEFFVFICGLFAFFCIAFLSPCPGERVV